MSDETFGPDHPGGARQPPARGWVRFRQRLAVFTVDAAVLVAALALLGFIGGTLANGPHPTIGGRSGADVVVVVVLMILIGLGVLYARAIRRGRTPGQRAAKYRR
jgi:uncharacterized RDD family membrane protein YckC